MMLYEARAKHYLDLKKIICKRLETDVVLVDKLWTRNTLRVYQLKVCINMLNDKYVVRLIENNDLYKLEMCKTSENLFRPAMECFPLLDDVNELMRKTDMLKGIRNFSEMFNDSFAEKFGLSEALSEKEPSELLNLGCWSNERQGLRIEAKANPFTFEMWV